LCGGDLYEQERFIPDTREFLVSTFASMHPIPVLIAPGNHDWLAPSSIYATAKWSANVHVFGNDRLEPYELGPGVTIWGAAHRAPVNTEDFLRDFHARREGLNIGLFHASERSGLPLQPNGKEPHAPFSAYEIAGAGLDHALLGHYHAPIDGPDYTYPGNPEPLAFGETGERGVVLVDIGDDGAITRERVRVSHTVLEDVRVDVSGASSSQDVLDRVAAALAGHKGIARVSLSGDVAPSLSLDSGVLQQAASDLQFVQFLTEAVRPAYDVDVIAEEKTVRGQFVRDVLNTPLDDVERRRVLVTGLRALEGRNDLEVA